MIQEKSERICKNIIFGNFNVLEIEHSENVGKVGDRSNPTIRPVISCKSLIHDQCFPENTKSRNVGNMGSLNL